MILDALKDAQDKHILDAGCGDGFFTNTLTKLGADVCGCDGSKKFIDIAKKEFCNVDFKVCDLTKELLYEDNSFDIVVCSLTLMDIDSIDIFLKESARVLKKDGKLIFTIVHPCFFQAEWKTNDDGKKLYKKVYNYYDQNTEILNIWGNTTHYHRPISWYAKALKNSGFVIECISENPDNLENFVPIKPHQKKIPLFICFSCISR